MILSIPNFDFPQFRIDLSILPKNEHFVVFFWMQIQESWTILCFECKGSQKNQLYMALTAQDPN